MRADSARSMTKNIDDVERIHSKSFILSCLASIFLPKKRTRYEKLL